MRSHLPPSSSEPPRKQRPTTTTMLCPSHQLNLTSKVQSKRQASSQISNHPSSDLTHLQSRIKFYLITTMRATLLKQKKLFLISTHSLCPGLTKMLSVWRLVLPNSNRTFQCHHRRRHQRKIPMSPSNNNTLLL